MKDLSQVLLNPVRSRIIQYLALNNEATAGDISSFISDVPRTTLYRHLKILVEHNVITVVAENRVRGSVERTYSLNTTMLSEENTVENATRNAFSFLMKIYADYERYFSNKDADPYRDKIFLSNVSLLLSDEEFDELLKETNTLLMARINNEPNENRRQRSLSIITSPCDEEGGK